MTTFGPWLMPLHYGSIIEEHRATRERAGLFDTCHMGEIGFAGPGAVETLERVFTRCVADLPPGRARYGFLTTEEGTVVDDGVLYCLPEQHSPPDFLLCVNAGDIPGDLAWIKEHAGADTVIQDLSPVTGKIDLQGPASGRILEECAGSGVTIERFGFAFVELAGHMVCVSRSGYTGEDGFEIFTTGPVVQALWERLLAAGRPHGLLPAGLGARDTLRMEACLPLYGHELSREITPIEAGFGWALSFEKDFVGRAALQRQAEDGPARCSMPFRMAGRVPARPGCPVYADNAPAGVVTSGTYLPSLGVPGGMCLVAAACAEEGRAVEIEIRNRRHEAYLVARPLFERRS
jgi:aminomethyltransferase